MSYWYIAHQDELLVDLDAYDRATKSGGTWQEIFFRRRLRQAIKGGLLHVKKVYLLESNTAGHHQAIIVLNKDRKLSRFSALTWQLHLGSDLYRGKADLMRLCMGIRSPSLLITPHPIQGLRAPDYTCPCTTKHKTEEQAALGNRACPIWRRVRGLSPWELFGEPETDTEEEVSLPIGEVPMSLIMEVRRAAK